MSRVDALSWRVAVDLLPDGVLIVDADDTVVHANPRAALLLGRHRSELVGRTCPATGGAQPDGDPSHDTFVWERQPDDRREIAFRRAPQPAVDGAFLLTLHDVTVERRQERRVRAVARTAARHGSAGSLQATLDALAIEIVQAEAISGVQIFALDANRRELRVMGSAGFRHRDDFFDRLVACQHLGADLRQFQAMDEKRPIVVPRRSQWVMQAAAWAPFHEYYRDVPWDSFASVPILVRGEAEGVLNIFSAAGQEIDQRMVEFLVAMAEQAAIAIEYAGLLEKERDATRQVERARLAADLHDSIVQHMFSVGMQAQTVRLMAERGVPANGIVAVADEIIGLSSAVLADLRAMVHDLRPKSSSLVQLEAAVRDLVGSTARRSSLAIRLSADLGSDSRLVDGRLTEDVYRIVAEALHNVVKHAESQSVSVELGIVNDAVELVVADDGRGLRAVSTDDRRRGGASGGYGIESMRERAARWGGQLDIRDRSPDSGTALRALIPLPAGPTRLEPADDRSARPNAGPPAPPGSRPAPPGSET